MGMVSQVNFSSLFLYSSRLDLHINRPAAATAGVFIEGQNIRNSVDLRTRPGLGGLNLIEIVQSKTTRFCSVANFILASFDC